ncbi:putative translation initiation factor IF-1 [Plasmodium gaboni]|uniref:Putative translation initiation factor IF-1 n=1 Tax=Plasmodium gaboni TaxID=647221 RepID=A0A151LBD6_9APIC|nr:putative translation initiation factor IF-1 [Plasmodium gaboni]KYN96275.1 putative translation initiation factor IF-1 [Plasmodium gaboni]
MCSVFITRLSFSFFVFLFLVFFLYIPSEEIKVENKRFSFLNFNNNILPWGNNKTSSRRFHKIPWNKNHMKNNINHFLRDKKGVQITLYGKNENVKNDNSKTKENDTFEMNGVVVECLANTNFIVSIPNGEKFLCFISGKLRINKVKINLGDMVKFQIHKLNFEKRRGKIVFRYLQHTPLKKKK